MGTGSYSSGYGKNDEGPSSNKSSSSSSNKSSSSSSQSRSSGPSASSPAGGAQAASGRGQSYGPSTSESGSRSTSSTSGRSSGSSSTSSSGRGSSASTGTVGGGLSTASGWSSGSANSLGPSTYGPSYSTSRSESGSRSTSATSGRSSSPSARQAESASMAAMGTVGRGLSTQSSQPSARQAESASMSALRDRQRGGPQTGPRSSARQAEAQSMARHNALQNTLSTIRAGEARRTDPYNSLVYGLGDRRTPTHAPLTEMTVAEVMAYQREMRQRGHASTAVGAYQFVRGTLSEAVKRTGIDPNTTKFTPTIQDMLAIDLIDNRARQATRDGSVNPDTLADRLASEWASFANSTGRSSYHGDRVGNRANIDYGTVRRLADSLVDSGAVGGQTIASAMQGGRLAGAYDVAAVAPDVQRFETTYLGRTTPSARPTRPDQVEQAPQQTRQRGLGGRIAAGAIDVASGMVPVVGNVVGAANMAASLTGRRTIGERIVDDFTSGKGRVPESTFAMSRGDDREAPRKVESDAKDRLRARDPVAAFEEAYLTPYEPFKDDTPRPTPQEKWGTGRDRYGSREYA